MSQRRLAAIVMSLALSVLPDDGAHAAMITLQPGPAGKDSLVYDVFRTFDAAPIGGNVNDGNEQFVAVNFGGGGLPDFSRYLRQRGLLEFDLSSVPVGDTVVSASLTLFQQFNFRYSRIPDAI